MFSARKIMAAALGVLLWSASSAFAAGDRVKVTGEVIDTWCYLTEIMFAEGSAHHQCAVWCAAGGIPVGILGASGHARRDPRGVMGTLSFSSGLSSPDTFALPTLRVSRASLPSARLRRAS